MVIQSLSWAVVEFTHRGIHSDLARMRDRSDLADEAQRDLLQALDIARGQQALSLELREMCDLADLWADAGERTKAREWLAPLRAQFTEGVGMPDLQRADNLLVELQ